LINKYLNNNKFKIEFQTIYPVIDNNNSVVNKLNSSYSPYKIEPYKFISQIIHKDDYRDGGVPFFWHPLQMSMTLDKLINPDKINKDPFFKDVYSIMRNGIFMHDVGETLHSKGFDVNSWLNYMKKLDENEVNQYIIEETRYFTNLKNLPREEHFNEINNYDRFMRFILHFNKFLDIYNNSLSIRKYAGKKKTNERISKLKTDSKFIKKAYNVITKDNLSEIIKDFNLVYNISKLTQTNLSNNIEEYKQQIAA
jgi:hypothetical protein